MNEMRKSKTIALKEKEKRGRFVNMRKRWKERKKNMEKRREKFLACKEIRCCFVSRVEASALRLGMTRVLYLLGRSRGKCTDMSAACEPRVSEVRAACGLQVS